MWRQHSNPHVTTLIVVAVALGIAWGHYFTGQHLPDYWLFGVIVLTIGWAGLFVSQVIAPCFQQPKQQLSPHLYHHIAPFLTTIAATTVSWMVYVLEGIDGADPPLVVHYLCVALSVATLVYATELTHLWELRIRPRPYTWRCAVASQGVTGLMVLVMWLRPFAEQAPQAATLTMAAILLGSTAILLVKATTSQRNKQPAATLDKTP